MTPEDLRALYTGTAEPLTEEERSFYDGSVMVLLTEDLWTARDMYDSCHYLMVPMHYAFRSGDAETVERFAAFFARFEADVTGSDAYRFCEGGTLNRFHFFYLCTQFTVLCAAYGYDALIPASIPALAESFAENFLLNTTANWETEPTVLAHLQQVLAGKEYSRSYYQTIEDFDRFSLAILCDLRCLALLRGEQPSETMDTAAMLTYEIFSAPHLNQETQQGGWLFQPGVGCDYPDNAYAGNPTVTEGLQPLPREDVPEDSSHFTRMPLLLTSYQSAQPTLERQEIFRTRKQQLANQMVFYVLQNVDGHWLTTTFMDGTNGVYRYSYNTEGVGLEGYDLSGSFLLGWWAFLEDSRITRCYQDILNTFPMEGNRSNPYFDHAGVREQNPFFDMDTAFDKGMFETTVACAAKLGGCVRGGAIRRRSLCHDKSLPHDQRPQTRGWAHLPQGMYLSGKGRLRRVSGGAGGEL